VIAPRGADALTTSRLVLDRLTTADADRLHRIQSDPVLWRDDPEGVHQRLEQTLELLDAVDRAWDRVGLGLRAVRQRPPDELVAGERLGESDVDPGELLGTCGVMPFYFGGRLVWNLGYRLSASAHGHGVATEAAAATMDEMRRLHPEDPVIGRVKSTNSASIRVLEKVGLRELGRTGARDTTDSDARVVFADRGLDDEYARLLIAFG